MKALKEAVKFNIDQAKADPLFNKTMIWTLISFISVLLTQVIYTYCVSDLIIKESVKEQAKIAELECELAAMKEV